MMIPHILFTASWAMLLNPTNGILNRLLMDVFGLSNTVFNIYSLHRRWWPWPPWWDTN